VKTVGIIGYGKESFGELLAQNLSQVFTVKVSSRNPDSVPPKWRATLADVAKCDVLIPSIPLSVYESVFTGIKNHISDKTVIVDVCSVKTRPVEIIEKIMPHQPLVATHPLFGPQSAAHGIYGHTLVMCPDVSDTEPYVALKKLATQVGLRVIEKTAEEHDREMAVVQGLTFFVARALLNSGIHDMTLHTPSFQKLLSLAELESHHTEDIFTTIQKGNPYTAEIRDLFIDQVADLNKKLTS
jgi:prephenate dehydrogenase